MARDTTQKDQAKAENLAAAGQQSQLQSASAEPEHKVDNEPGAVADKTGETQFFDTTILKVKEDEDGNEVVVMSDHLDPGEKLKRDVDADKAEKKDKSLKDKVVDKLGGSDRK